MAQCPRVTGIESNHANIAKKFYIYNRYFTITLDYFSSCKCMIS